jgi:predicted alpha/beta-hydrolase family hydrolase
VDALDAKGPLIIGGSRWGGRVASLVADELSILSVGEPLRTSWM